MPFRIVRGDITKIHADAIVNTANPNPTVGGGTDTAIYEAAGREKLLAERKKIGKIERGEAVATPAFGLHARYILHTVGPAWVDGSHGEREILRSCYEKTLLLAEKLGCRSVAFPLIATGSYGFPRDEALSIALSEIGKFLLSRDMDVTLAVFDRSSFMLSAETFSDIQEYIDEHYVAERERFEYAGRRYRRENTAAQETSASSITMSLDDLLENRGDTFQQRLFKLIDERGLTDVAVYKAANIDRKVFSKIRCKPDYRPKKGTALSFCVALKLSMEETSDLLSCAGLALSPGSKTDVIVAYFITHKVYDIFKINAALFNYGEPALTD